jgi:hypothetical protein
VTFKVFTNASPPSAWAGSAFPETAASINMSVAKMITVFFQIALIVYAPVPKDL